MRRRLLALFGLAGISAETFGVLGIAGAGVVGLDIAGEHGIGDANERVGLVGLHLQPIARLGAHRSNGLHHPLGLVGEENRARARHHRARDLQVHAPARREAGRWSVRGRK